MISFEIGFSQDIADKLLQNIDKIDILYIDGDHSYKGMLRDYNNYHHKVRTGGLIIVHDIYPDKCGWWGPRIFLDTIRRSYLGKSYEIVEMDTPDGFGLAILKKTFDGKKNIADNFIYENFRKFLSFYKNGGRFSQLLNYIRDGGSIKDFFTKV